MTILSGDLDLLQPTTNKINPKFTAFSVSGESMVKRLRPYETSQDTNHMTIWRTSDGGRKPKSENYQALAMEGETHDVISDAATDRTWVVAVRGTSVTTDKDKNEYPENENV